MSHDKIAQQNTQHQHIPITPEHVPSPQRAFPQFQHQPHGMPSSQTILSMQRTIGNQRTRHVLAQRMIQREEAAAEPANAPQTTLDLDGMFTRLMAGDFMHKGQYQEAELAAPDSTTETPKTHKAFDRFVDNDLHALWTLYMQWWAPNVPMKPTMSKAGDSSGKAADHPQWVVEFQQKLIGQVAKGDKGAKPAPKPKPKAGEAPAETPAASPLLVWDRASEGAQKLLEAYLNAWSVQNSASNLQQPASNVEEFIHNIGSSQTNNQAILMGGNRDSNDWCAISSGRAVALGLMRRGIRFKGTKPVRIDPQKGVLMAMLDDLNAQSVRVNTWGGDFQSSATTEKQRVKESAAVRKTAEDAGHVEKSDNLAAALLKPGDRITAIFGGMTGPISGHVATVVKEELKPGMTPEKIAQLEENTEVSTVTIVSGNAAGVVTNESAIRMESFTRIITPGGYPQLNGKMVSAANHYQYTLIPAFRLAEKASRADPTDAAKKAAMQKAKKALDDYKSTAAYPVSRDHSKFQLGLHAPKESGHGWIIAIMRSSQLDANALIENGTAKADELEKQGLEVFDEESLTKPNAGLNKLYPGALALFE